MVIQQLLVDAGAKDLDMDMVMVDPQGLEVAADWRSPAVARDLPRLRPEQRVRARGFAFLRPLARLRGSPRPAVNSWDLTGDWTVAQHAAVLNAAGGRITFAFHARDVNLVMGPATAGASIPFRVSLDGHGADGANGTDVDADGSGVLADQNTYQLIRQTGRSTTASSRSSSSRPERRGIRIRPLGL